MRSLPPLHSIVVFATPRLNPLSARRPWYLNYVNYPLDWRPYYRVEPFNFTGSAAQKARVLGGEAAMWAEHVDGSNIIQRLWPRVGAVAERLWSPMDTVDEVDAEQRLRGFRCSLVARGIAVSGALVVMRSCCHFTPTRTCTHALRPRAGGACGQGHLLRAGVRF